MDYIDTLYEVLEAARSASFPAVEQIMKHSTLGVDKQSIILLALNPEETADTGSNQTLGITQVCNIWVLKRLGNQTLLEVLPGVDDNANAVLEVLKSNPKLVTTSYPNGFLLRSTIISKDPGFANHDGHHWASVHILLAGKFIRRAS
jgi:hypothetical protein